MSLKFDDVAARAPEKRQAVFSLPENAFIDYHRPLGQGADLTRWKQRLGKDAPSIPLNARPRSQSRGIGRRLLRVIGGAL